MRIYRTMPSGKQYVAFLSLIATLISSACAVPSDVDGHAATLQSTYTHDVFQLSTAADKAYRQSRWIDAARDYQKLTELVPQDAYAWFRLGNTYAQQGAYAQSIHAYEASIERDSRQPKPWFNLSTALLLSAQQAMQNSWQKLREDDPARELIKHRLELLQVLMHDRIEDTLIRTNVR